MPTIGGREGARVVDSTPASASQGNGPTVEQALYAILFVVALGLRLYSLGDLNAVSPLEAAQIWPAWLDQSANWLEESGLPEPRPPASPLLHTVQRALFLITGGGSSFWARFGPACAGAGLVLAAWGLRKRMGRGAALMAAALFAFDPWLLSFSRMADGATLSVLTGVLLLAALFDGRKDGPQVDRLAVTGGLFLISGPLAWLLLPVLLYALYLLKGGPLAELAQSQSRRAAVICAGTVVVGSTGLFSNLSGLSAIGESVGAAVAHLVGSSGAAGILLADHSYSVEWALLRLLVDEPFVLLFGLSGMAIALYGTAFSAVDMARQNVNDGEAVETEKGVLVDDIWLNVLAVGVAWGLLLFLLPGLTPVNLLVTGLPLLLLAAGTATRMLRAVPVGMLIRDSSRMPALATMGILLITAFFWTGTISVSLRDGNFDARLATFYLLIPALGAFFVWWSGERASLHVFGFLALSALLLAQASSSWMLNLRPEYDHSRTLYAETSDSGMALLAEDIAKLSSLRTGDPREASVYLQVEYSYLPFFYWNLRSMRDLRWHPGIDLTGVEADALVVTQGTSGNGGDSDMLPAGFVGSSYSVTQRWLPTELESPGAVLRWMLYRERQQIPGATPVRREVDLWVIGER
ncbi:MAG: hypothetical protein OXF54_05700 [Caldilineaceae bacterium]|nr:hypothetical protein [Caldilineaceae bacterium]